MAQSPAASKPKFFSSAAEFRKWLAQNHAKASELLVGFHKRATGTPSMTWSESVDEALNARSRASRFQQLLACCEAGKSVPPLTRPEAKRAKG